MSIEDLERRFRAVRGPMSADIDAADLIQPGEVKLGHGFNCVVLSNGQVEINTEDPSVGMKLHPEGSVVAPGGSMSMTTDIEKVDYNGKILNPQAKHRAPNVVAYYPLVLTMPSGLKGSLLSGALQHIISILKSMGEEYADED